MKFECAVPEELSDEELTASMIASLTDSANAKHPRKLSLAEVYESHL